MTQTKKTLSRALAILLCLTCLSGSLKLSAQTGATVGKNGVTSVKFTAKRDFVIGLQGQATRYTLKLTVDYDEAANVIKLKAENDSVEMTTDLHFEFFRMKLDELVKDITNQDNTVAISSSMDVFYWVYTLVTAEDQAPRSGFLTLDQYVMVLPVAVDRDLNYEEGYRKRTEEVDKLTGQILEYNSRLNYAKEEALKVILKYKDEWLTNYATTTMVIEANDFSPNNLSGSRMLKHFVIDTSKTTLAKVEEFLNFLIDIDSVNLISDNNAAQKSGVKTSQLIAYNCKNCDTVVYSFSLKWQKAGVIDYNPSKEGDEYTFFRLLKGPLNDALKAQAALDALQARLKASNLYKVKDVQMQFEKGFLERVQVKVEVNGRDQIFENIYAIGFSSPADFKALSRQRLFIRNYYLTNENKSTYIFLGDVIQNYTNELNNYTRDYSPADTSLTVKPETSSFIVLQKEHITNLFEAKIYTDLIGVLQDEPNGLVQIEIGRRFNLITKRFQLGSNRSDIGFFNFFNVTATVSKVENKQRTLLLQNDNVVENNTIVSPSYATNLDFRKYENFGVQTDFNLFLWDYPDGKTMFFIDPGFRYSYTPVSDSVRTYVDSLSTVVVGPGARNLQAHMFTLYPKFTFEFFAERRYGFSMSYQYNHSWLFSNNQFKQVRSYEKGDNGLLPIESSARNSHQIDLYMRIEPNPKSSNGKIFARARFFLQDNDVNTFFSQIQIGYAYNFIYSR